MNLEEAQARQIEARLEQTQREIDILKAHNASQNANVSLRKTSGLEARQRELREMRVEIQSAAEAHRKKMAAKFEKRWRELQDDVDSEFEKLDAFSDAFLQKAEAEAAEADAEIAYLDAMGDTMRADAKVMLAETAAHLRTMRDAAKRRLAEARESRHAASTEVLRATQS